MKSIDGLIAEEEKFQSFLQDDHYTIIASKELLSNWEGFRKEINECSPYTDVIRSAKDDLSYKPCVHKAIRNLPKGTKLEILVIIPTDYDDLATPFLSLQSYCKNYEINFLSE